MNRRLIDLKVAVLVANGFEEIEFTEPIAALVKEGAEVSVISPEKEKVKAWAKTDWGKEYDVDKTLTRANAAEYDALLLPVLVFVLFNASKSNPNKLRPV